CPRRLDVKRLMTARRPVRRLVLWRAMNEMAGGRTVSFPNVEAALRLLDAKSGSVDPPGHCVERAGSRLVLTCRRNRQNRKHPAGPANITNRWEYPLSIP